MSMPYDPWREASDEVYRAWLHQQEADPTQDSMLASDDERDQVCRRLSHAFSEGRLTPEELEDRTSRALAARTYGDLEEVLAGLNRQGLGLGARPGAAPRPAPYPPMGYAPTGQAWAPVTYAPPGNPVARVMFWVVGFFTSPFLMAGVGMVLFGGGGASMFFGIVVLMVLVPGLVALYRAGHPRRY